MGESERDRGREREEQAGRQAGRQTDRQTDRLQKCRTAEHLVLRCSSA